jgi:hypothetical protein
MNKSDMPEFIKILTGLAAMFDKQLTELLRDMYFDSLADLNIEQIRDAGNHIARSATFFPKPVDFRNSAGGNKDLQALTAWEKTRTAVRKVGRYESVKFDDPLIHSVITTMGGWEAFCSCEGYDGEKWQQHDFEKMYKTMVGANRDHPEYLAGMTELDNSARGFDIRKPMLIGHKEQEAIE